MTTLVEVEEHVPITALLKELLDVQVGGLKRLAEVLDVKVQLTHALFDLGMEWRDAGLKYLDDVLVGVVEDEKALDLDRPEPLCGAVQIDSFSGVFQFFDKDEGEPAVPQLYRPPPAKPSITARRKRSC
jgi:hypothetical protein